MASQVPPKKATAFNLGFTLYKNDGTLVANPTSLTAKISKDFGNYASISSMSVEDTTYGQVKAALTTTEMDADILMVYVTDLATGTVPFTQTIYTAANLLDETKVETSSIYAATNSVTAYVSPGISSIYAATNSVTAYVSPGISSIYVATNSVTAYVSPGISSIYNRVNAVPTALHISSLVWEEARASHTTAGTFGDIDTTTDIADALLDRDMSLGSDSGSATVRTPRQAFRMLRNKWTATANTLTVTKEDDTTASWIAALTTDSLAIPVTGADPASS